MISSPIFAYCAQVAQPMRLMAVGLGIWSCATLVAGLSLNYWMLLFARAATGVGEASFVCLAPPYILDTAPRNKKTVTPTQLWVSIFYSAMTLGYATGFIYGHETTVLAGTWRSPLLIESVAMLPLILMAVFMRKEEDLGTQPDGSDGQDRVSIFHQIATLSRLPIFLLVVVGYSAYAFTIGGLAFWGNSIIEASYGISTRLAVLSLGGMTVFCGVVATVLGSLYMDRLLLPRLKLLEEERINETEMMQTRTEVACRLAFYTITCGALIGTFSAFLRSYLGFISALGLAEFMLFLYAPHRGTGPVGMAVMSSVPPELRGQANAVSVFLMHLLGDFPSPYVIGLVNQFVGMRWGVLILVSWLFFGVVAWGIAWSIARQKEVPYLDDGMKIESEKLVPHCA